MSQAGEGVSLGEFCESVSLVPPLLKMTIAVNLVQSVLVLHEAQICHNDFHPDNVVLLDKTTGEVAIIDYESSRNIGAGDSRPLTTRPAAPCTTLHNLLAILQRRALKNETIGYESDMVSVMCSLLLLVVDGHQFGHTALPEGARGDA
mmetsp:Transcript_22072/g.62930  ORF Transcript_22072/g.62930 Transcript_22072/m.62930 type:complete len:148 (+) Transcript_22072:176-619(+)